MSTSRTLAGQRVLITGGSGGIGTALARDVARQGGTPVLLARDAARLAAAADAVGSGIETHLLDVTDEPAVQAFFARQPPLDHLVTAAAGTARGTVQEMDTAKARALFESKYWGQVLCCKYAIARLRTTGSIVLFSGWISRKPMAGVSTLAAVDAAIEALGRTLALEVAPRRVNVVTPGMIDTPLWAARLSPEQQRAHFAKVGRDLPVGRAGTAQDVAHAVMFLLENGFTTGAVIDVDGGSDELPPPFDGLAHARDHLDAWSRRDEAALREVLDVVTGREHKLVIQRMSRRTMAGALIEAEGASVMHRREGRIVINADFRHRGA